MPGVTGREVKVAYARTNTWGTPASVLQQLPLATAAGLDTIPAVVDDETFSQAFLGEGDLGDTPPISTGLEMTARFEQMDKLLAAGFGSAAGATVVSSQAANSLVAYSHVVTLAPELTQYFTLAVDTGQYVQEVPSFKVRGWAMRVGENGRMMVTFNIVGNKTVYNSTVNTNSTVGGATAASLGNRLFRKNGRFRINAQSAAALAAADVASLVMDFSFDCSRPVREGDYVHGLDYITDPDDSGFPEFTVEVTFARGNTQTMNSLALAAVTGTLFKADYQITGPYINTTTQRSITLEFPALQLYGYTGDPSPADQVQPKARFRAKLAASTPTGMNGVLPVRMTIINANSATLL